MAIKLIAMISRSAKTPFCHQVWERPLGRIVVKPSLHSLSMFRLGKRVLICDSSGLGWRRSLVCGHRRGRHWRPAWLGWVCCPTTSTYGVHRRGFTGTASRLGLVIERANQAIVAELVAGGYTSWTGVSNPTWSASASCTGASPSDLATFDCLDFVFELYGK